MSITADLLNITVTISRYDNTVSDSGDSTRSLVQLYTGAPARITTNKLDNRSMHLPESGAGTMSSHICFLDYLYTIEVGDVVTDNNGEKFTVRFVDDRVGGTSNHIQLYIDKVDPV